MKDLIQKFKQLPKSIKVMLVSLLVSGYFVTAVVCCAEPDLTIPGWEHGVVVCGADVVMIDVGHTKDPEVGQLLQLAENCK